MFLLKYEAFYLHLLYSNHWKEKILEKSLGSCMALVGRCTNLFNTDSSLAVVEHLSLSFWMSFTADPKLTHSLFEAEISSVQLSKHIGTEGRWGEDIVFVCLFVFVSSLKRIEVPSFFHSFSIVEKSLLALKYLESHNAAVNPLCYF